MNYKSENIVTMNELTDVKQIALRTIKYTNKFSEFNFYNDVIKRGLDIIAATLGLIIISPMFLCIAILIKIESKGPALFKQKRIGKNGKVFEMYKFRTMVSNAENVLQDLLKDEKYKKEWKQNQKIEDDPRITKIGKFLRKTSIDEIPQFINVLKGDMSFIGPRPLVKEELDVHKGSHAIYESIRPGITSWWASHGRNNTTYEERLELEYYYIKNQSIWLDIKCIYATMKAILKKTGAK